MIFLFILIGIGLLFLMIGQYNKADIIISPVIGIMTGFLYSTDDYEDYTEHTLQCVIFIISITIIWEKPNGLL